MADVLREKPSDAQACIDAGKEMNVGTPRQNPNRHSRAYALVPKDHELVYLERAAFPLRRSGTVKLSDTASFLEYWKRQSGPDSYIYGSMAPAQFLAVFNEHAAAAANGEGNWRDHRALYTLEHSDEWTEWMLHDKKPFDGNETFAYWLEENLFDIWMPDPAKFMDIALNMRVKQGQVFGNKVNLNDGNIVLEYVNQIDATAGAAGKLAIPERFQINIPVFKGLNAPRYKIDARFRYRLAGSTLRIQYTLVRPMKVLDAAFKAILTEIQKTAKTKCLWGTPE